LRFSPFDRLFDDGRIAVTHNNMAAAGRHGHGDLSTHPACSDDEYSFNRLGRHEMFQPWSRLGKPSVPHGEEVDDKSSTP
jgi:hypothetical protein